MDTLTTDTVFDIDAMLSREEIEWKLRARRFGEERILPTIEQDFEDRHFRSELVGELGRLGFLGMHLSGYGCSGAGAVSYGVACLELEAADSGWRTFVSVQGSLAMSAIHRFGSEEQKQQWLPKMAAGQAIGCFGLTEPSGGSDPAGMLTTARRDGGDWVLSGSKRWIGLASIADVAVVWARTDDGVRGFLIPAGTRGYRAVPIDNNVPIHASIQCDLFFDECRLPASAMLPDARGLSGPFSCLNEARYGIIWGAMGAARSCLEAVSPTLCTMSGSADPNRARRSGGRSGRGSSSSRSLPTCSSSTRRGCCWRCISGGRRKPAPSRTRRSASGN